jgi:hypothetical protein
MNQSLLILPYDSTTNDVLFDRIIEFSDSLDPADETTRIKLSGYNQGMACGNVDFLGRFAKEKRKNVIKRAVDILITEHPNVSSVQVEFLNK